MDRFGSILYLERHLDGSSRAFSSALLLAGVNRAHLCVAAVMDPDRESDWQGRLDTLAARAAASGVRVSTLLLQGDPRARLLEAVRRDRYDLVVTVAGSPPPPSLAAAHPLDRALLRSLPASLWLVAPCARDHVKVVLAGLSLDEDEPGDSDRRVVEAASTFARRTGADLVFAHFLTHLGESVMPGSLLRAGRRLRGAEALHDERSERMRELVRTTAPWSEASIVVEQADPQRGLTALARRLEADVVLVGNTERPGVGGRLFGNLTERLTGRIHGSLLALRPHPKRAPHRVGQGRWDAVAQQTGGQPANWSRRAASL